MTNPDPHTALFRVAIMQDTDSDKANLNQKGMGQIAMRIMKRITLKKIH